jgi:hypothetical protein
VLSLLRIIALVDVGILAGAVGLCWLAGWRSVAQYGESLVYLGGTAIVLGVLSVGGQYMGVRGNAPYLVARSVSDASMGARTQQMLTDLFADYRFLVMALLSGLPIILLGLQIASGTR